MEQQEEKGAAEDEMAGWHHRLNGHEFWANSRRQWRTGKPGMLQSQTRPSNLTTTAWWSSSWMPHPGPDNLPRPTCLPPESSFLTPTKRTAVAPHSSILAWQIPWTEKPGRLQSMGSQRVGHDWATSLSVFTFMHWRRKWQPTPEFLPGQSQGQGSLVGCCLWGRTELDRTEAT